jgi:cob(I)alamin adenosyltransferase
MHVFIAQFVKGMHYSELDAVKRFGGLVELRQYGRGCFIRDEPTPADIQEARRGLGEVREVLRAGRHRLVILDEANIATHFGLFMVDEFLELIEDKPAHVELVITGRCADPRVLERADLVTEMREVKHYYARGVQARQGIEK